MVGQKTRCHLLLERELICDGLSKAFFCKPTVSLCSCFCCADQSEDIQMLRYSPLPTPYPLYDRLWIVPCNCVYAALLCLSPHEGSSWLHYFLIYLFNCWGRRVAVFIVLLILYYTMRLLRWHRCLCYVSSFEACVSWLVNT